MKALSNYIAAIITVSMIFTSIFFLVTTMIRQARLSGYALTSMSYMIDKARESVNIDYVVRNRTIVLYIYNRGEGDILVNNIILILKNLTVYRYNVTYTIPLGSITKIEFKLPCNLSDIYSFKITTSRGNVFDILTKAAAPIDKLVLVNTTKISSGSYFELSIVIINKMSKAIVLNPTRLNISFIDHVSKKTIDEYFEQKSRFPIDALILEPGAQVIIRYTYTYLGGLQPPVIIDIMVYLSVDTVEYEYLESSSYSAHVFIITG